MDDRDLLVGDRAGGATFGELTDVLASCIAQNILEPRLDHLNKGQLWLVLYLNRLLCLHHDLPLGYGGWRPQKLPTLAKWLIGTSAKEDTLV